LLSPVDSLKSQNNIFGLVARTISPVSPLQGMYDVSALIGATSSAEVVVDSFFAFATLFSLTEQMQ